MLYSIVAVLVVILDQAVKYWVTNTLFGEDIVKFIPGVVSLVNVHNDGAAFSFLSGGGARIYFIIITVVFCVLVIIALATNFISGRISRWSIVFIAAGGFANCIDRVINGYVVDMFKFEISFLQNFPVFNVADIFITIFAVVFALAMIFERQSDDDEEDEFYDEEEEEKERKKAEKRAAKSEKRAERKPLFSRDRDRDIDEEDEAPAPAPSAARKPKKTNYAAEYEQYKAERAARNRAAGAQSTPSTQSAAQPQPTKSDSNNPFAEWEQANERAASQRGGTYAAKAMGTVAPDYTRQSARSAAKVAPSAAVPEVKAQTVAKTQVAEPDLPSVPQSQSGDAKAQSAKKPAASSEFDLEDILAEFK